MKRSTRKRGSGAPVLVVLGWLFLFLGGCTALRSGTDLVIALIGFGLGCLVTAVVLAIEAR